MKTDIRIKSEQLTKEALHALLQAIRSCEVSTFPEKPISISIIAPELTVKETTNLLTSIDPPYDFGPIIISPESEVRTAQGLKLIQALWLTPGGTAQTSTANIQGVLGTMMEMMDRNIGIIVCEDERTHTRKAYIGIGSGANEALDTKRIMEVGGTFPIETAELIIKALKGGRGERKRKRKADPRRT